MEKFKCLDVQVDHGVLQLSEIFEKYRAIYDLCNFIRINNCQFVQRAKIKWLMKVDVNSGSFMLVLKV